jgi:hypothetical protein
MKTVCARTFLSTKEAIKVVFETITLKSTMMGVREL